MSVKRPSFAPVGAAASVRCKGGNVEVHHIVQEADGGGDNIENAIVLCFECHAEAGHYNPRHPRGTKYSPEELRRHRDEWWRYCADYRREHLPQGYRAPVGSGHGVPVQQREVGTLWSNGADITPARETLEFEARLLAGLRHEDQTVVQHRELFVRADGLFYVFVQATHRGDWCEAWLDGAPPDTTPLSVDEVFERYPDLATAAGLQRRRRL